MDVEGEEIVLAQNLCPALYNTTSQKLKKKSCFPIMYIILSGENVINSCGVHDNWTKFRHAC